MRDALIQEAFFNVVRAGLWEKDILLLPYGEIDYNELYRLGQEQSVMGLVAAGLEHIADVKPPKESLLKFAGSALQLEQRNRDMNKFIERLFADSQESCVYAILVKGQGIAQCYERPLWRSCGDVDLLLSEEGYQKAKDLLLLRASSKEAEGAYKKHFGMTIDSWVVELHGTLRTGLSHRIDRIIDSVQHDVFYSGNVRSWLNGNTLVFLPGVDDDVVFIFTHFLKHFYIEGLGLRQICDWCRLLWTYREKIDRQLLDKRLRQMGLMAEWKAFAAFAVDYLGMPVEAMPFYEELGRWKKKALRICEFILMCGNMGHNRESYSGKYPYLIRKVCSLRRRLEDCVKHLKIFPKDSLRFLLSLFSHGMQDAIRGE